MTSHNACDVTTERLTAQYPLSLASSVRSESIDTPFGLQGNPFEGMWLRAMMNAIFGCIYELENSEAKEIIIFENPVCHKMPQNQYLTVRLCMNHHQCLLGRGGVTYPGAGLGP